MSFPLDNDHYAASSLPKTITIYAAPIHRDIFGKRTILNGRSIPRFPKSRHKTQHDIVIEIRHTMGAPYWLGFTLRSA